MVIDDNFYEQLSMSSMVNPLEYTETIFNIHEIIDPNNKSHFIAVEEGELLEHLSCIGKDLIFRIKEVFYDLGKKDGFDKGYNKGHNNGFLKGEKRGIKIQKDIFKNLPWYKRLFNKF